MPLRFLNKTQDAALTDVFSKKNKCTEASVLRSSDIVHFFVIHTHVQVFIGGCHRMATNLLGLPEPSRTN